MEDLKMQMLLNRISQKDIALYLGVHPATICRQLKDNNLPERKRERIKEAIEILGDEKTCLK